MQRRLRVSRAGRTDTERSPAMIRSIAADVAADFRRGVFIGNHIDHRADVLVTAGRPLR